MEVHPHVQQLNAITTVLGILMGMLQQKGLVTETEMNQVMDFSKKMNDDAPSGLKIIGLLEHMAREINSFRHEN